LNEIGRVVITTAKPIFFDAYVKNRETGSFIFIDPITHNTCAVGMIIDKLSSDQLPSKIVNIDREKISSGVGLISKNEFEKSYEQTGSTIWITGLHGSGKNELAYTLHRNLFDMGAKVMLLDGKSVRLGLSRELDYSPTDRAEHLRRVAHLCRLMNDQGILVICSFVSPDEEIRLQVEDVIGKENFNLVYLDAHVDYCRENDEYGIYKQADEGKLKYLPGVDMQYQSPSNPSLKLDAVDKTSNLEKVIGYLAEQKIYPV
ncbi:MAG: adenylyl-sulfate kinase, partial [Bacteroidetes bacterium]